MMDRILTGFALTPVAGLVGTVHVVLWWPSPAAVFFFGIIFGSIFALPTTCIVLPCVHAALRDNELRPILLAGAGLTSGTLSMALALRGDLPTQLVFVTAGGLAGLVAGALFNRLLSAIQKSAKPEPPTRRPGSFASRHR